MPNNGKLSFLKNIHFLFCLLNRHFQYLIKHLIKNSLVQEEKSLKIPILGDLTFVSTFKVLCLFHTLVSGFHSLFFILSTIHGLVFASAVQFIHSQLSPFFPIFLSFCQKHLLGAICQALCKAAQHRDYRRESHGFCFQLA